VNSPSSLASGLLRSSETPPKLEVTHAAGFTLPRCSGAS
jgi:hypothetical protein